jgi:MarR family transcriptional regulator for hemolysin
MLMPLSDPRREAALRIVETSRLLRSLVDLRLREFGMTRTKYACLVRLEEHAGLVQAELADMLEVQPIAIVRLLDQMSAEGLIERRADARDRRCNRLFITAAGRARLASLAGFKAALGAEVFAGIEREQLDHLLAVMAKLHGNVKDILATTHADAKPARAARA